MTGKEQEIYKLLAEDPMITQEELAKKIGINRASVAVHISNMMKKGVVLGRGYVISKQEYITVVGGVNMDIGGTPFETLVARDSNPGTVNMTPGGVGRNIAHDLALLGKSVKLISALGDDPYAKQIKENCNENGIDIHDSLFKNTNSTSVYLYVADETGDMQLAIADMKIYDDMTPEFMETRMGIINHSEAVIVDANIPQETIEYIVKNAKVKVFAETVSTTKAMKFQDCLKGIYCITPNIIEAEALSGVSVNPNSERSLARASNILMKKGAKKVIITLSKDGAYYADRNGKGLIPALENNPINTTGAGDALIAGVATAITAGYNLRDSVVFGMVCSSETIESEKTNNPDLTFEVARKRAGLKRLKD